MNAFEMEAAAYAAKRALDAREASQLAALRLACGIDIDAALASAPDRRQITIERIERAIRAERAKGLARHWSYDLNRHIALKQALDRVRAANQL